MNTKETPPPGSIQQMVRTPNGTIEIRPVVGWEAAVCWMTTALMHAEKALEWSMGNRPHRTSKTKYYMMLMREAAANAKREIGSPNAELTDGRRGHSVQ